MSLPHRDDPCKTNRYETDGDDTCWARLTGRGRSAIAVIGVAGRDAARLIHQGFEPATPHDLASGQIRYGRWIGAGGIAASESVVVTPLAGGRFEIHCHGGIAAVERIVHDLSEFGASEVPADHWSGGENLLIIEARQVLSECLTARTAAVALDQLRGGMTDWATHWIDQLSAGPAAPIPINTDRREVAAAPTADAIATINQQAESTLAHAPIGLRLGAPFRVVLVGPPNVGKSSLSNAIVGYDRSITADQAGTTRDVLHTETVIDGLPIRLSDTAGIRDGVGEIERAGIARARQAAGQADLMLIITSPDVGGTLPLPPAAGSDRGEGGAASHLCVLNKSDLLQAGQRPPTGSIATNALSGEGIADLLQAIAAALGKLMPPAGQAVPLTARQVDLLRQLARSSSSSDALSLLHRLLNSQ